MYQKDYGTCKKNLYVCFNITKNHFYKKESLNFVIIFIFIVLLFSVACKKESFENSNIQMDNSLILNSSDNFSFQKWYLLNSNRLNDVSWIEIKNVKSLEDRRRIFNSLTAYTKARVGIEKFDSLIGRPQFNVEQKQYFSEY